MRLIALLSFYDEPETDLVACLSGLADAGCDAVVAVDGAYSLYPDGKAASPSKQHAAITLACRHLGMTCTLHVPSATWAGNEVEKRTFLFKLAHAVSEPGDWFWIMDADQVVTKAPDDLKDRLGLCGLEAAEIEVLDVVAERANQPDWPAYFTVRDLFRAQPITVQTNHITYVAADGRLLWGYDGQGELVPALDLSKDVLMEHRPDRRSQERQVAKLCYYARRDQERVERGDCNRCGVPAVRLVPTNWRITDIGPVADWAEACEDCTAVHAEVERIRLISLGIDPDSVQVENRMGAAPAKVGAR